MAEYKGIHGTKIRNYTTNPDNPLTGEVWYNDTDNVLKFQYANTLTSWRTGGNLNTGRDNVQLGVGGTQTAAIVAGGEYPNATANVERYDGTSWTEVNNLTTARMGGAISGGPSAYTAALLSGGYIHPSPGASVLVEKWNGTNWTEVNDISTARSSGVGAGTNTAALMVGGTPSAVTELWNGTNWTEVNDLNAARYAQAGCGTSTSMICFSGSPEPGGVVLNESWNGTNWTETTDLNHAFVYGASGGTQTSALGFGGQDSTGSIALTESWNGSAWTETADLATARNTLGGAGASNSSALAFGGAGTSTATEEFTADAAQGSWTTINSLNTAREGLAGA